MSSPLSGAQPSDCCACWNTSPLNPKTWILTAKKVAQLSGIVVAICAMAILVSGLMVRYPEASGAFFTGFSIVAAAGLTTMIIALVKHCDQRRSPRFSLSSSFAAE